MSSKLTLTSTIPIPTHPPKHMPRLGFGVYQSHGPTCISSVLHALRSGYRHIDSAQFYRNEVQVQTVVQQEQQQPKGVPRDQLFLTTKMLSPAGSVDATYRKVLDSVGKLGGEAGYVDLFLVHTASGGTGSRETMWKALERGYREGRCGAIGVSNWGVRHIEEMRSYAEVWPPHVNQIELHPWCQQREIVKYCQEKGIVVQAYCPLVRNTKAKDPTLNKLAEKYKKGTGQILIRYCLQKDWSPLPKSDTPSRIEGNADVYDFEIDAEDMKVLDGLDQGPRGAIVESVVN